MPLSRFQSHVLRLLAAHRNPESYVAGAAPLARSGSRFSHAIDLVHDRELAQAEYDRLQTETPIDAAATARALRVALDSADAFVRTMPAGTEGLLFLRADGRPVQPDPAQLGSYTAHGGQQRGHWPSSPEISRAMFERYGQAPDR